MLGHVKGAQETDKCALWLVNGDDVNGDTMSANDHGEAFNGWNRNRNKHCLKDISCICMCCAYWSLKASVSVCVAYCAVCRDKLGKDN